MAESNSSIQPIGNVFVIHGTVKAVSADGVERTLSPNSPVFANERILTGNNGSVSISFNDPDQSQLDLGRMSDIYLDEDVYDNTAPTDVSEAAPTAEQIQAAIKSGEFNPATDLPAPAAGAEELAASADGGTVYTIFDQTGAEVTPESGTFTTSDEGTFFTPDGGTPDGVPSVLELTKSVVDETDGLQSVNGALKVSYGPDGPGSLSLSSPNYDATWSADTNTLSADDGTWEIVVHPDSGEYTFTQLEAISHPVAGDIPIAHNDTFVLHVTILAEDHDGDLASNSYITVTVDDDGPVIIDSSDDLTLDEMAETGNISAEGNLSDNFDFGTDGAAAQSIYSVNGITANSSGHIVIDTPAYSVDITAQTGAYTVTLNENPIPELQNENLNDLTTNGLELSVVAEDGDGDQVSNTIKVDVKAPDVIPTSISDDNPAEATDIDGDAGAETVDISTLIDESGTDTY